jgi:thioredoxin-like negative regulator of GroEL
MTKNAFAAFFLLAACSQPPAAPKPEAKPVAPVLASQSPAIAVTPPTEAQSDTPKTKELVAWRRDVTFAKLLEEAKAQNKPMMIDVYATWCGPCQEMDKSVYSRQDVADATAKFIAVKLDGERGEGAEVHAKYNVVGFPTILFLHPDGTEIDRVFGGVNAEDFLKAVNDYAENKNTITELDAKLAAAGDTADLALFYEVGYRHCIRGDADKAEEILQKTIARDKDNAKGYASKSLFALGNFLYLRGQSDPKKAIEAMERLQREYPASKEASAVLPSIGKAYLLLKQPEKTRALLDEYIAAKGATSNEYNKYAWFCFQNKYDLPRGIEVAKLGLEKNPKDDALWDTLAELLYASNDAKGAVDAENKAIGLAPEDDYYKEQKTRFGGVR